MIIGGHLKDIPLPHKRRWPGADRQRKVRAQISRFIGAGGRHYYASMEQEANHIWDSRPGYRPGILNGWTGCWDDEEGKGKYFHTEKFDTHVQATMWVEKMMLKHFPDHELVVDDYSGEYYAKYEGD